MHLAARARSMYGSSLTFLFPDFPNMLHEAANGPEIHEKGVHMTKGQFVTDLTNGGG